MIAKVKALLDGLVICDRLHMFQIEAEKQILKFLRISGIGLEVSIGQAFGLLPNGHQFESSQGHWWSTWLLTSGPREISRGAHKLARRPRI